MINLETDLIVSNILESLIEYDKDCYNFDCKYYDLTITKENDGSFYIKCWYYAGDGHVYDGYAPLHVSTLKEAVRDFVLNCGLWGVLVC